MHALGVEDEDDVKVNCKSKALDEDADDDESKPVVIYDEENLICDEFMTGSRQRPRSGRVSRQRPLSGMISRYSQAIQKHAVQKHQRPSHEYGTGFRQQYTNKKPIMTSKTQAKHQPTD